MSEVGVRSHAAWIRSSGPLVFLVALLTAFFGPMFLRGDVIATHDNSLEVGLEPTQVKGYQSNRALSDHSSFYIPEIDHNLNGDRRGWLSTWNPHVELGRPAVHVSGFSPAFLFTRVLSFLTDDALVLYTWLTVLTVALIGIFGFLFLRALGLHPWAACAVGAGLATSIFVVSRLAAIMFVAGLCWTLCLLWAIALFTERRTIGRGLLLAFSIYALLLSAYPQQIVWHAYLAIAFALARLWRAAPDQRRWMVIGLLGWGGLGLASALPVYLDVAVQAARSSRIDVADEFFLARMPDFDGLRGAGALLFQFFDTFWRGQAADPDNRFQFNAICLTPFFASLIPLLAFDRGWKRAGLWLAFSAVCFAMTVWPALYLFGVDHLWLSLSRFTPLWAALIPLGVCTAVALDNVLRGALGRPALALSLAALPGVLALAGALATGLTLRPRFVAIGLAVAAGTCALVLVRRVWLVLLLVSATAFLYGARRLYTFPEDAILKTSPLVEALRRETRGETRYAVVGPGSFLPPNQEASFGLKSIHSYNSLSGKIYQDWTLRLSGKGSTGYGRKFLRISESGLASPELGYAAISMLVSARELESAGLVEVAKENGIRVYRTPVTPVLEAQIEGFVQQDAANVVLRGPMDRQRRLGVERIEAHDDYLRLRVTPAREPTLLFVSAQFHPQWVARGAQGELATVLVNGFYQGVVLPPETSEVELEFLPFVRWSWIPQWLFLVGGVCTAGGAWLRRRRPDQRVTAGA